MMNKTLFYILPLLFAMILISQHSMAQQFQNKYNSWEVYTVYQNGEKLCYMVSFPTAKTGNYRYRSDPYAMLTITGDHHEEFSVTGGYKYKPGTEPRTIIDGKKYKLSFTAGEMAWFKTKKYRNIAVKQMKKGSTLKVVGTSTKGTYSIDTYSLRGFTRAYKTIRSFCDIGRRA